MLHGMMQGPACMLPSEATAIYVFNDDKIPGTNKIQIPGSQTIKSITDFAAAHEFFYMEGTQILW